MEEKETDTMSGHGTSTSRVPMSTTNYLTYLQADYLKVPTVGTRTLEAINDGVTMWL